MNIVYLPFIDDGDVDGRMVRRGERSGPGLLHHDVDARLRINQLYSDEHVVVHFQHLHNIIFNLMQHQPFRQLY